MSETEGFCKSTKNPAGTTVNVSAREPRRSSPQQARRRRPVLEHGPPPPPGEGRLTGGPVSPFLERTSFRAWCRRSHIRPRNLQLSSTSVYCGRGNPQTLTRKRCSGMKSTF